MNRLTASIDDIRDVARATIGLVPLAGGLARQRTLITTAVRIEREHDTTKPALALGAGRPEKYREPGEHRDSDVTPVPECRRRNRTNQDVTHDAARGSRHERDDQHTEEIQPVIDPGGRSAEGEDERAHQVEDEQRAHRRILLESAERLKDLF